MYSYSVTGQLLGTSTGADSLNCSSYPRAAITNCYLGNRLLTPVDRLGTVRYNASTGQSFAYYPWGEERASGTTDSGGFMFGTYWRDGYLGGGSNPSDQDYALARYYNNKLGRFWSSDPRRHANMANPQSWNQYAYAGGDPTNRRDPRGTQSQDSADDPGEGDGPGNEDWGEDRCGPGESIFDGICVVAIFDPDQKGLPYAGGGNGGGGYPPANIMDSPTPTRSQRDTLLAAYYDALGRLQQPQCAGLFEGDTIPSSLATAFASTTLETTQYQIVAFGVDSTAGAQVQSPTFVQVNSQGAMFATPNAQEQLYMSVPDPTTGVMTQLAPLPAADVGAFILLHELGHQAGVFGADTGNDALEGQESWSILQNCFGLQPPQ